MFAFIILEWFGGGEGLVGELDDLDDDGGFVAVFFVVVEVVLEDAFVI